MPYEKQRIVSLLPSATEIICGLGWQDQLVGISHECNWPPCIRHLPRVTRSNVNSSADSLQIDEQVKTLLAAGQSLYDVDVELLTSLGPDVILTQSQCDVCAVSYESVVELVEGHSALNGASLIALNPNSIDDVLDDIVHVGNVLGTTAAALQYRAALQQRIDLVVANRAPKGQRPRVLIIEWTDPLMIAGNWTPQLVDLAGGQYGLAEPGKHSRYVTWDEVIAFAPGVVVVAPCGFNEERSRAELNRLEKSARWHEIPASKAGQTHAVDGDAFFNRPGPRLVDSIEMLARFLSAEANRMGSFQ